MNPPPRSTFVSVLGWIFAVLSGLGLTISVMQNIMLHAVFPLEQMKGDIPADFPPMARFAFEHFELMFLIPLVAFAALLAASVGLIRRLEWARRLMALLMGLAALWSLVSIALQVVWMGQMPSPPAGAFDGFRTMQTTMLIFASLWGLGFATLFAWIGRRLLSWDIAQEFRGTTMD
jgi:hypothetical protein